MAINDFSEIDRTSKICPMSRVFDFKETVPSLLNLKNAAAYGIDNTGITDVTTKVQELLDSCVDGDVVYFPGLYKISSNISISKTITLVGNPGKDFVGKNNSTHSFQPQQSAFILDDTVSNITMMSSLIYTCPKIKNIAFCSYSGEQLRSDTVATHGSPYLTRTYNTIKESVNGLDVSLSDAVLLENVSFYGFSGYGLKSGKANRLNKITIRHCMTGMDVGIDNMISDPYISQCDTAIYQRVADVMVISGLWIDQIGKYGILCESSNAGKWNISGYIDLCGYAGVKAALLRSSIINLAFSRCGNYFGGALLAELSSADYEKSCCFYVYQVEASLINISTDYKNCGQLGDGGKSPCAGLILEYISAHSNYNILADDTLCVPFKNLGSAYTTTIFTEGEVRTYDDYNVYDNYKKLLNAKDGATGSFTTTDGKTITIVDGQITAIV